MSETGDAQTLSSRDALAIPVFLLVLALLLMTAFQLSDLLRDRTVLQQRLSELDKPLQEAAKVKGQVEAVARGVALLAQQGNAGAQAIVEQLRQAGITVNPNAPVQ
ncbi:MAG: hypothetical protein MUF16_18110 [Burkholderiaceae bacterium]|nr:hypothetical protein [Burkholderiaceae bacterium]